MMAFASVLVAVHRCSRCGEIGHNVRNCPKSPGRVWYSQRCSVCGEVGHNARNCAKRKNNYKRCPVCNGRGTLPCGKCGGSGILVVAKTSTKPVTVNRVRATGTEKTVSAVPKSIKLSEQQREWARLARERTRVLRGAIEDDEEFFVGEDTIVGNDEGEVWSNLVGGKSVDLAKKFAWPRKGTLPDLPPLGSSKCPRCSGLGYLCCLSCSD